LHKRRLKRGEKYAKQTNNVLLFTYLYKYITFIFGCRGQYADALLKYVAGSWFTHVPGAPRSRDKSSPLFIKDIFEGMSQQECVLREIAVNKGDCSQIAKVLTEFDRHFFSDPTNRLETYVHTIQGVIDETGCDLIKFAIDNNYYVGLSYSIRGEVEGHIVVIVGCESNPRISGLTIVIKNSWGDLNGIYSRELGGQHVKGRIKTNTNYQRIDSGKLLFAFPSEIMRRFEDILISKGLMPPRAFYEMSPRTRTSPLSLDEMMPFPMEPDLGMGEGATRGSKSSSSFHIRNKTVSHKNKHGVNGIVNAQSVPIRRIRSSKSRGTKGINQKINARKMSTI